ncbi:MAG: hypothetical protein ACRC6D_06335 [Aeromonas sp.]
MDLHRLVKDGLSWFLITANSAILFLSISSLDNLATSQANVVKAFESSSEALSSNANSIILGVTALDEFGMCLAASVDSAADAFSVFEGVIDRHIELARIQSDVVRRQGRYLQEFTEGLLRLNNVGKEPSPSFGNDSADDLEEIYKIKRADGLKLIEELNRINDSADDLEDIYGIKRKEGLKLIEELNKVDDSFYELIKPIKRPSQRPAVELSRASYVESDEELDHPYDREDFTFGDVPYQLTRKLSSLCCLYKLTVRAYHEKEISLNLFYDIVGVLEDLAKTEADRLEAELESAGWVLVRKESGRILT